MMSGAEQIPWLAGLLAGASATGLVFTALRAFQSGFAAYSGAYSENTARQFEDVFLFIPPQRLAEVSWAGAGLVFLFIFIGMANFGTLTGILAPLLLAALAAIGVLLLPRLLLRWLKARRLRKFNLQLVDTLVSMSNALKAGFSIMQAFESVVRDGENPIAQEFDVFLQQTRLGMSFTEALLAMERRVGSDDLTLVVQAIEATRKTGGNLTEIFEKIAATIRERIRIENRIRTLTAQGRLQGIIVGSMPLVILAALTVVDPRMMMPFLHSIPGMVIIGAVAVMVACGGFVIKRIITIDV